VFDVGHPEVRDAVERALAEDIGTGDITSELTVPENLQGRGTFIAKQSLVLAGIELLPLIYDLRGGAHVHMLASSGSKISIGDELATVVASARTLLECERVSLNFLQRLSGVATLARKYVDAVAGTNVHVLDTRKTTPGLRQLEKMAAAAGGVINHRRGLFDQVLIKNNHIAAAGGVRAALEKAKWFRGPVGIEVRTRDELDEALSAGANRLLLDNLCPAEAAEWIRYIAGRATVELSGGINLDNIRAYAEAGPDFISCGAITHSAPAVDISFRLEIAEGVQTPPAVPVANREAC
jgi:nicotinate-nucleotide pyrophosphorylase (carboxylating)